MVTQKRFLLSMTKRRPALLAICARRCRFYRPTACDGLDGLDKLNAFEPDLISLDPRYAETLRHQILS
jgi:hypothetical protein